MNQTTIFYKTKTVLIERLEKQPNISALKEKNFFSKIFSKKEYADIYFHTGNLTEKAIENIKNSKTIIVNSFSVKNEIIEKLEIKKDNIQVIYPSINIDFKDPSIIKKKICEEFKIDFDSKIIFFTAKNLKSSGVKEFLDICSKLTYENFKIILASTEQQINSLKFQLSKYEGIKNKLILLENYKNIDNLFLASDIFILPTTSKSFNSNILKAMFCECAVFVTIQNDAKEVVDVFASMDNPSDASILFKIDAILASENDLEQIKKQNRVLAQEFAVSNNLEKINQLIGNV